MFCPLFMLHSMEFRYFTKHSADISIDDRCDVNNSVIDGPLCIYLVIGVYYLYINKIEVAEFNK